MISWLVWLLRAWAGLVFVIAGAAVLDHDPSAGGTSTGAVRVGEPAPSSTTPTTTPPAPEPVVAEPVVAAPVGVDAPSVGISTDLVPVGKTAEGALAVPDFGLAGWYQHSVRPGESGPAVLAGHVDSTTGPDVFFTLGELVPGDEIDVRRGDGSVATFVVDHVEMTDKDALPIERIFGATDEPALRLITCGGAFDRSIRSYESNVIVYASAADGSSSALASR